MSQFSVAIDQYNFSVEVTDVDCGGLCFSVNDGWFDMEDGSREPMGEELQPIVNQLSGLIVGDLWKQIYDARCVL